MASMTAGIGKMLGNNKGSFQNFGIVGVTISSESLTKFIFFFCPCQYPHNKIYGTTFIWGPAIVLFIVGYLVNRRTWRLTTGLCNRTQGIGRGGKRIFHFVFIFIQIGVKAIIAPATWVVLAFLKGDYYACARWPDPEHFQVRPEYNLAINNNSLPLPCEFSSNPAKAIVTKEAETVARNLRAESHVIGWFIISIGMFLGVICMFAFRCKSKYSYEQSNYIERYRKSEVELFEESLSNKAEEQAKRIVDGYFTKPRSKEEWDQIAVINDKVTRSKRGRAIYSPLHKFVNKELRAAEDAKDLDIVKDAAMKLKSLLPFRKKKAASNNSKNGSHVATPPGGNKGRGAAFPMVAMASLGKSKTVVKEPEKHLEEKKTTDPQEKVEEQKPPPEQKETTEKRDQEGTLPPIVPPRNPFVPPSVNPFVPKTKVVYPPQPLQQHGTNAPSSLHPIVPAPSGSRGQQVVPPEKDEDALRETSLGDFGGYYSEEDLRHIGDEDEEEEDVGDVQYHPVKTSGAGDGNPLLHKL